MSPLIVASFFVDRPGEFPGPQYPVIAPYLDMLKILDGSCARAGMDHVVLTDHATAPNIQAAGLTAFALDLSWNLMKATNEAHAQWFAYDPGVDTVCVGADCLIRRDFRAELPSGDMAIAYMLGHKKWRMQNGFVYVPAASRAKVATLFREIADDTGEAMCDDMLAIERALLPMPEDYGVHERRGLAVNFLPLPKWNRYMAETKQTPDPLADAAEDAAVLHFMGGWSTGKALYFSWAKAHGFA